MISAAGLVVLILFLIAVGIVVYYGILCLQAYPTDSKPSHPDMGPLLLHQHDMNANREDRSVVLTLEQPDAGFSSEKSKGEKSDPDKDVQFLEYSMDPAVFPATTPQCASLLPKNGKIGRANQSNLESSPKNENPTSLSPVTSTPIRKQKQNGILSGNPNDDHILNLTQTDPQLEKIPNEGNEFQESPLSVSYEEDGLLLPRNRSLKRNARFTPVEEELDIPAQPKNQINPNLSTEKENLLKNDVVLENEKNKPSRPIILEGLQSRASNQNPTNDEETIVDHQNELDENIKKDKVENDPTNSFKNNENFTSVKRVKISPVREFILETPGQQNDRDCHEVCVSVKKFPPNETPESQIIGQKTAPEPRKNSKLPLNVTPDLFNDPSCITPRVVEHVLNLANKFEETSDTEMEIEKINYENARNANLNAEKVKTSNENLNPMKKDISGNLALKKPSPVGWNLPESDFDSSSDERSTLVGDGETSDTNTSTTIRNESPIDLSVELDENCLQKVVCLQNYDSVGKNKNLPSKEYRSTDNLTGKEGRLDFYGGSVNSLRSESSDPEITEYSFHNKASCDSLTAQAIASEVYQEENVQLKQVNLVKFEKINARAVNSNVDQSVNTKGLENLNHPNVDALERNVDAIENRTPDEKVTESKVDSEILSHELPGTPPNTPPCLKYGDTALIIENPCVRADFDGVDEVDENRRIRSHSGSTNSSTNSSDASTSTMNGSYNFNTAEVEKIDILSEEDEIIENTENKNSEVEKNNSEQNTSKNNKNKKQKNRNKRKNKS